MSRPPRMSYWYVSHSGGFSNGSCWWVPSLRKWMTLQEARETGKPFCSSAHARCAKQAFRIAHRMPYPDVAIVTFRTSRKSRKWPNGFERDYTCK